MEITFFNVLGVLILLAPGKYFYHEISKQKCIYMYAAKVSHVHKKYNSLDIKEICRYYFLNLFFVILTIKTRTV